MKRILFVLIVSILPLFILAEEKAVTETKLEAVKAPKIKIGIPGFTLANDPLNTAKNVYGAFAGEYKKDERVELIEKDEYENLLKTKGLKDSRCKTSACLENAAKTLGINKIIIGMVTKTLPRYAIEVSIYREEH